MCINLIGVFTIPIIHLPIPVIRNFWQPIGIDGELEFGGDVVLARSGLLQRKHPRLRIFLTLVGLVGLVLEFGAECPTQGLILEGFILVQNADDACP